MSGVPGLVARLLYVSGMRISEALQLRVKDLSFDRQEIVVRDGKGRKDRVTILPKSRSLGTRDLRAYMYATTTGHTTRKPYHEA